MDRFTQKIIEETGLNPEEIKFYECFYKNAGLTDKVIMFGDVKDGIGKLSRNENNQKTPEELRVAKEVAYQLWLMRFQSMDLVHKLEAHYHSESYPVLKGYTPLDDPEFYIAYRKEGCEGRLPIELLPSKQAQMLKEGYEFRKL